MSQTAIEWGWLRIDGKPVAAKVHRVPKTKFIFPLRHSHKLCEGFRQLAAYKSGAAEGNCQWLGTFRGDRELLGTGRTISDGGTFSSLGQLYRRATV